MVHRRAPVRANRSIGRRSGRVDGGDQNGREALRLDADEAESQAALSPGAKAALSAIGAWAHMDWDETLAELERIRRESKPSPPIEDLSGGISSMPPR